MTIRFSAARGGTTPAIVRALCPFAPLNAANDNARAQAASTACLRRVGDGLAAGYTPPIVPDALRHFARYGLSAALQASLKAEAAMAAGDHMGYTRWLAICSQFDRRMANATARSFEQAD